MSRASPRRTSPPGRWTSTVRPSVTQRRRTPRAARRCRRAGPARPCSEPRTWPAGRCARPARPSPGDRGGQRDRQLVEGLVDVDADPDDGHRAAGRSRSARPGCRPPCASPIEHVVGPLQRDARAAGRPSAACDGVPGQQRQPRPRAGGTSGRSSTENVSDERARRLPHPVQPAAPGGLVLGDQHQARTSRPRGPARRARVGRGAAPPAPRPASAPRREPAGRVDRWARCRRRHVMGTRLPDGTTDHRARRPPRECTAG